MIDSHHRHYRHHGHHPSGRTKHNRPFQKGDFKYILLQFLQEKPSYGYEIIRALQERFHSFYIPSPGIVYPTLQMLEEMGHVTSAEEDSKKIYTITEQGRTFLAEQKELDERISNHMKNWWNHDNIDDISDTMRDFSRLAQLLNEKARTADTKILNRIRKTIARAYEEISKD